LGGKASARTRKLRTDLADTLGLLTVGAKLRPYVEQAKDWARAQLGWMAETVGGGVVGPGVASIVQSAALALAASRYLTAEGTKTGDADMLGKASRLADRSRQALLTAHELCAREAKAREASGADAGELAALIERATAPREESTP